MKLFKCKKSLALVVIFSILATIITPLTNGFLAKAETAGAINDLKTAWQALNKVERELFMAPKSDSYRVSTSNEILALTGVTVDKLGDYSIKRKFTSNSGQVSWVLANGKSFADIKNYEKIGFYFTAINNDGSALTADFNKKYKLQFNNTNGYDYFITPDSSGAYEVVIDSSTALKNGTTAGVYFNGTKGLTAVRILPNECTAQTFIAGGIFGYYTKSYPLPENTEDWDADKWIEAAEKIDLSDTSPSDIADFSEKLTALRTLTERGQSYNHLLEEIKKCGFTLPDGYITMSLGELLSFANDVDKSELTNIQLENLNVAIAEVKKFEAKIAIEKLKDAWVKLEREERELWLTPLSTADYVFETDQEVLSLLNVSEEKIGSKYIKYDFNKRGFVTWEPAKNRTYDDVTKYDKVGFYYYLTNSDGTKIPSNFYNSINLQFNNNAAYNTYKVPSANSAIEWVLTESSKIGASAYFSELTSGELNIRNVKIMGGSCGDKVIYVGGFYGYYTKIYTLPENSEDWGVKEWIKSAETLDITGCDEDDIEEFTKALINLREFTESGMAYNDVLEKLSQLTKEHRVVIAIPNTYRKETDDAIAEKMGLTKEQIGEYYAELDFAANAICGIYAPSSDKGDYSIFKRLKKIEFFFKGINADGTPASSGGNNKIVFQLNSSTTGYYAQSNASNGKVNIYSTDNNFGKYFTDTEVSTIKFMKSGELNNYLVSSVFGYYDGGIDLPEGYVTMSLGDILTYLEKQDYSGYDATALSELETVIAIAQPYRYEVNEFAVEKLKSDLLDAWRALSGQKTEVYAIPSYNNRKETNAEIAAQMGISEDKIGPYYVEADLKSSQEFYSPLVEGTSHASLDGYDYISFYFQGLDENKQIVSNSSFNFQMSNSNLYGDFHNAWPLQTSKPSALYTITSENENYEVFFNGEGKVGTIKLMSSNSPKYIVMSSIFATRTLRPELPENYEKISLPALCKFAKALDTSDYSANTVEKFNKAITNAENTAKNVVVCAENALEEAWMALGKPLPQDDVVLLKAAAALDVSDITDKALIRNFAEAYMTLNSYSIEGYYVNNLKHAWESLGKTLPENYYNLSSASWVIAADTLKTLGCDAEKLRTFKSARDKLFDYITLGKADATALENLIDKSKKMNSADFTDNTWTNFADARAKGEALLGDLSKASQLTVDNAVDEIMTEWGKLRYFIRTLYVDFGDYYLGEPDVDCKITGTDTQATDTINKKDNVPNGFTTSVTLNNIEDHTKVTFRNKELPSSKDVEFLEYYIKVDKDFNFTSANVSAKIQFRGGTQWTDSYFSMNRTFTDGNWHRIQSSTENMLITNYNKPNEEKEKFAETDYIAKTIEVMLLSGGNGTFTLSSIAKVTTEAAVAGVVPIIPELDTNRPPVIMPEPPVNPFTGLDRGDPWGDLERLNNKHKVETEEKFETELPEESVDEDGKETTKIIKKKYFRRKKNNSSFFEDYLAVFMVAGVLAVSTGAVITVLLIKRKRKAVNKI